MRQQINITMKRKRVIAAIVAVCLLAASISVIARPDKMIEAWYRPPETKQMRQHAQRLADYIAAEQIPEEKVRQATYAVQRVTDNLQEILRMTPAAEMLQTSTEEQDKKLAQTLQAAFDEDEAAYWALRLEADFDSLQAALDEYLYCLQVGLDIALYETDRDSYETQAAESEIKLRREEALSTQRLEEMMLEVLRGSSAQQQNELDITPQREAGLPAAQNPAANVVPQQQDPRPQDPGAQAMREVEAITQGWMR